MTEGLGNYGKHEKIGGKFHLQLSPELLENPDLQMEINHFSQDYCRGILDLAEGIGIITNEEKSEYLGMEPEDLEKKVVRLELLMPKTVFKSHTFHRLYKVGLAFHNQVFCEEVDQRHISERFAAIYKEYVLSCCSRKQILQDPDKYFRDHLDNYLEKLKVTGLVEEDKVALVRGIEDENFRTLQSLELIAYYFITLRAAKRIGEACFFFDLIPETELQLLPELKNEEEYQLVAWELYKWVSAIKATQLKTEALEKRIIEEARKLLGDFVTQETQKIQLAKDLAGKAEEFGLDLAARDRIEAELLEQQKAVEIKRLADEVRRRVEDPIHYNHKLAVLIHRFNS